MPETREQDTSTGWRQHWWSAAPRSAHAAVTLVAVLLGSWGAGVLGRRVIYDAAMSPGDLGAVVGWALWLAAGWELIPRHRGWRTWAGFLAAAVVAVAAGVIVARVAATFGDGFPAPLPAAAAAVVVGLGLLFASPSAGPRG